MSEAISSVQAGAVIAACWAIISGIGAWKREFIGKRQIELAELVLAKFFEARDAIAMIRSPFGHQGEGSTRKRNAAETPEESAVLDNGYVAFERYLTKETVFTELNTLKYRFMASFGPQSEKIFIETTMAVNLILMSAQMLGTHYWKRQGRVAMTPEESEEHLREMTRHQKIFWDQGGDDDVIRMKLAAVERQLGETVAPCFREPISSYTWLTRARNWWGKKTD
jgi:hypothetical protein